MSKENPQQQDKPIILTGEDAKRFNEQHEKSISRIEQQQGSRDELVEAEWKVLKALRNLVHLKEWKDKHGKDGHYEQFQPEAWSYAREALEDYSLAAASNNLKTDK